MGKGVPMSKFTTRRARKIKIKGDRFGEVCTTRISRKNSKKECGCYAISKNRFSVCNYHLSRSASMSELGRGVSELNVVPLV